MQNSRCMCVGVWDKTQPTNWRTNGRANERLQLNVCARTPANNMIDEMHNGTVIFYADSNWVIYRLLFLPFGSAFREFKCANNRSEQNVLYNDFGWAIRPMQDTNFGISKRLRFIFIFWQWNTKSQRVIERERDGENRKKQQYAPPRLFNDQHDWLYCLQVSSVSNE